jgi:hypothetical protein
MQQRLRGVAFELGGRLCLLDFVLVLEVKHVEGVVDLHLLQTAHFDLFGVGKGLKPACNRTYILELRRWFFLLSRVDSNLLVIPF